MVGFGATLQSHAIKGWRYIDYEALKHLIARGVSPRVFYSKLIVEIDAANADFRSRLSDGDAPTSALRRAAVLHYSGRPLPLPLVEHNQA